MSLAYSITRCLDYAILKEFYNTKQQFQRLAQSKQTCQLCNISFLINDKLTSICVNIITYYGNDSLKSIYNI